MGAVNPFRMWRDLDGGAKLAVYTRLSLEAMVVFFGLYIVAVVAFTDNDANPAGVAHGPRHRGVPAPPRRRCRSP